MNKICIQIYIEEEEKYKVCAQVYIEEEFTFKFKQKESLDLKHISFSNLFYSPYFCFF